MSVDRARLKTRAKVTIVQAKPNVITTSLLYILLVTLVSMLSTRLMNMNASMEQLELYMEYVQQGKVEYALELLGRMAPPPYAGLLSWVMDMMVGIVGLGFIIFLLNTIRGTGACFGNLLDGFGVIFKYIGLSIVSAFFIALWSLLLIVPGIIASYRYRMAIYILADDHSLSIMECLRRSKAMMDGHKGELLMMDLSFIGWNLAALVPFMGYFVQVWTVPYINMSYALYYEALRTGDQYGGAQFGPGCAV